ncbi:MAG: hypothetical protein E6672_01580 [Negativicoccus succinicivorans]|nr:hypothetical protein [Negativicoccus succinicivorans]
MKCFNALYERLNSAFTQGFTWDKKRYRDKENETMVEVEITEEEYDVLHQRYKEVHKGRGEEDGPVKPNLDFNYHIIEEGFKIDYNYINQNFGKFVKASLDENSSEEDIKKLKTSLHKNFASLPKERQIIAEMIIHDFENGDLEIKEGWDFNDYINDYSVSELDKEISELVDFTGIDEDQLRSMMNLNLTEKNLNEFGRFDALVASADIDLITRNLSTMKGSEVRQFISKIYLDKVLREFLLEGPFSLNNYNEHHKD